MLRVFNDPRLRLLIAILILFNVTILGCLCLLVTGKVVP
jgi:hypothetical protein